MAPADACQPYREFYTDLVEGEIEGLEAERLRSHLAECMTCEVEVKLLAGVVGTLRAIGEEDVPADLTARIMARVRTVSLWEWLVGGIAAVLRPTAVRVLAPAMAVALLLVAVRPHLPIQIHIDSGGAPRPGQQALVTPVWWGGKLFVNDKAHGPEQSGRVALRPGDSLRTAEGVQLALTFPEVAAVDVRARSSVIVKTEGIFLAGGRIRVRIDDARDRTHGPGMSSFMVETAHAHVVHLGTIFSVEADERSTRVEVTQGRVRVFSAGTARDEDIQAGQSASVDAQGALSTGPASDELPPVRSPRKQPEDVRIITREASSSGRP